MTAVVPGGGLIVVAALAVCLAVFIAYPLAMCRAADEDAGPDQEER